MTNLSQIKIEVRGTLCDLLAYYLISSSGCVLEAGKEVVFNPEDDEPIHDL